MSAETILIDPEREREFQDRGFTVVPLLTAEEVAETLERLSRILQEFGLTGKFGGDPAEFHVSYYNSDMDYQKAVAELVRSTFGPRLSRIARGYKVVAGGAFLKTPGAGEMGVHRDFTATPDPDEVTFTAWCALADADETNGTMCMLPGSHKLRGQITGPGTEPFFAGYPEKIRERSVAVRVRAGEALLFRTGMIHWSLPNKSDRFRPAAHFVAIPEASRHAIYLPAPGDPRARFDLLDLSATEVFDPASPPPSLGIRSNGNRTISWRELERVIDGQRGGLLDAIRRRLGAGTRSATHRGKKPTDRAEPVD